MAEISLTGEYFTLPGGAVFKAYGGKVEAHEYICIEYIPGCVVKLVRETATYVDTQDLDV